MARPVKEVSIRYNDKSVQVWRRGTYLGSVPLKKLCEYAGQSRNKRTAPVSAQELDEQAEAENGD